MKITELWTVPTYNRAFARRQWRKSLCDKFAKRNHKLMFSFRAFRIRHTA